MPKEYIREVSIKSFSKIPSDYILYWEPSEGSGFKESPMALSFTQIAPEETFYRNYVAFKGWALPGNTTRQVVQYTLEGRTARVNKIRLRADLRLEAYLGILYLVIISGKDGVSKVLHPVLKINPYNNVIQILKNDETYVTITNAQIFITNASRAGFITVLLDIDLQNEKYLKLLLGNREFDLSQYKLHSYPEYGEANSTYLLISFEQPATNQNYHWQIAHLSIDRLD